MLSLYLYDVSFVVVRVRGLRAVLLFLVDCLCLFSSLTLVVTSTVLVITSVAK